MTKKEKSAKNTKRILDIQELVRSAEKRKNDASIQIEAKNNEVKALFQRLREMRAKLAAAQAEYKSARKFLMNLEGDTEEYVSHIASLMAELEELLQPYDLNLAEMKAKLDAEEAKHIEHLKANMMELGWTEEQCRDAARSYISSLPDWTWFEQCRLLIERIRKCEYTQQMELRTSLLTSGLIMP